MVPEEFRQNCYRTSSNVREHVTISPPTAMLKDGSGIIFPPMFTFPKKYVSTALAASALDPSNRLEDSRHTVLRGPSKVKHHPTGLPPPTEFPRYVAASESGNVTSTKVFKHFKNYIIPVLRKSGVTKDMLVRLPWDRHASHESEELFALFEQENIHPAFFVPHASNLQQPHDLVYYHELKTASRKCIDLWVVFLARVSETLKIEDFPFVIQQAFLDTFTLENTKLALCAAGIFPFNPDKVLSKLEEKKTFAQWKTDLAAKDNTPDVDLTQVEAPALQPVRSRRNSAKTMTAWHRTSSDTLHNRSPKFISGAKRLQQHPNKLVVLPAEDPFDFEAEQQRLELMNVIREGYLDSSVVGKKPRGTRLGAIGDVFDSKTVSAKRKLVLENKAKADEKKQGVKRFKEAKKEEGKSIKLNNTNELAAQDIKIKRLKKVAQGLMTLLDIPAPRSDVKARGIVFCYCKGDPDGFMVGCDGVRAECPGNGWYHPACVGISDQQARDIEFTCHLCSYINNLRDSVHAKLACPLPLCAHGYGRDDYISPDGETCTC